MQRIYLPYLVRKMQLYVKRHSPYATRIQRFFKRMHRECKLSMDPKSLRGIAYRLLCQIRRISASSKLNLEAGLLRDGRSADMPLCDAIFGKTWMVDYLASLKHNDRLRLLGETGIINKLINHYNKVFHTAAESAKHRTDRIIAKKGLEHLLPIPVQSNIAPGNPVVKKAAEGKPIGKVKPANVAASEANERKAAKNADKAEARRQAASSKTAVSPKKGM
jgi:hypothetical protein